MKTKIVLLGSIPKGDEVRKDWIDWKEEYLNKIKKELPQAEFLHGDLIKDNVGEELVVGHDLWLVKHADIIIVDAKTKIGAGTAQEMVVAKLFGKPVISIIPKNTHHRKSDIVFDGENIPDWIHPFLFISSDFVAENVEEAIIWIKKIINKPLKFKDISIYEKAIQRFEKKLNLVHRKYKDKGW